MDDPIWQFSLQTTHALVWGGTLGIAMILCVRAVKLRTVVYVTTLLTLLLVTLGAYVRLTDAGLGCPDWPGCYGKLSPLHAEAEISDVHSVAPSGPVSQPKAWREMLHRYVASLVGAMVLAILIQVVLNRRRGGLEEDDPGRAIGLPIALLGFVILQGLFGKWTVTLLLKPVIVTMHLLGGMLILAMLTWLSARFCRLPTAGRPAEARFLRPWAMLGLFLLVVQIALGGWVSANYAALACIDFPMCHGQWAPEMDFANGFQLQRELGMTAEGAPLSNLALNAIHWSHRVGALLVFVYLGGLAYFVSRMHGLRRYGSAIIAALLLQVALGISNVVAMLPLPLAVAHNAGAALLLMAVVMLNFALKEETTR
jgi:cytochrome c oxidase assembly protein subunit 15